MDLMVDLWHFVVPVVDDVTDVLLLWQTYDEGPGALWWICLVSLIIADAERVYAMAYVLVLVTTVSLISLGFLFYITVLCLSFGLIDLSPPDDDGGCTRDVLCWPVDALSGGQFHDIGNVKWLFLDAITWSILGSRSRSSAIMSRFGFAGEASAREMERAGLVLRGIDSFLRRHPYTYLGRLIFRCPHGHQAPAHARSEESRRAMAMVRAVGETLVVDTLFLALSVSEEGWNFDFSGVAGLSSLFSILELVTELQYYIVEAEKYMVPGGVAPPEPQDGGGGTQLSLTQLVHRRRTRSPVRGGTVSAPNAMVRVRELDGPVTRASSTSLRRIMGAEHEALVVSAPAGVTAV